MAGARSPAADPRIPSGLNRSRFLQRNGEDQSFAESRGKIYVRELGETAALLQHPRAAGEDSGWMRLFRNARVWLA